MRKFLSLALALVMTLSLVTISAGAAEYKDLTDKDEIQYEEAVAVLNRIGVITGYEDGSFKPENELTRGAAAKIIVSLLIGPEAAENLGNASSPYPDVPAGNNFAGVISFCKTSNIINGYGDGTFRPQANLTGFAFAKMLLGALGYSVDIEGMKGDGWNMKVAALGQSAGLFDRLQFNGNNPVNREMACQMALNTLKATMVEYNGGFSVSAGDATVVGAQSRSFKVSNQEFARNINSRNSAAGTITQDNFYTVEFAEEHFVDLRMTHDKWTPTNNNFGRPSAEWDYKKVTIGTFPLVPDYSYNKQIAHADDSTDASKVRALGLANYKTTKSGTTVWLNGVEYPADSSLLRAMVDDTKAFDDHGCLTVGQIADLTDNGTIVEVYVSNNTADLITDIVVIQTQLMEVRRVGSDAVALQWYDGNGGAQDWEKGVAFNGYNQPAIQVKVNDVEVNDNYFDMLHGMKAGDLVAVVPVSVDGSSTEFEVGGAYVPETVNGTLTRVTTYGKVNDKDPAAIDVTVGGTKYPIAVWNAGDLRTVTADIVSVSKKDVTLYLDVNGNALLAKDIGSQKGYMVVKGYYNTLVDGRTVTMVEGWDVGGDEVSLNLGTNADSYKNTIKAGDLVRYSNEDVTASRADWKLLTGESNFIYDVAHTYNEDDATAPNGTDKYEIKSANARIRTSGGKNFYVDNGIKFIYVTFEDKNNDEVESIQIVNGVQNVTNNEIIARGNGHAAQLYTKDKTNDADKAVKVVVIKQESSSAISNNLLYVRDFLGTEGTDSNGNKIYGYTVAMMSSSGLEEEKTIYSDKRLARGDFASYAESSHSEFTPFYSLKAHDYQNKTTSTNSAQVAQVIHSANGWVRLGGYEAAGGTADTAITGATKTLGLGEAENNIVRIKDAKWLYLGPKGTDIRSCSDLYDYMYKDADGNIIEKDGNGIPVAQRSVQISFIYNDNVDNDSFRNVSFVVVTKIGLEVPEIGDDRTDTLPTNVKLNGVAVTGLKAPVDKDNKPVSGSAEPVSVTLTAEQLAGLTKDKLTYTAAGGSTVVVKLNSADWADATPAKDGDVITLTVTSGSGDIVVTYTINVKKEAPTGPVVDGDNESDFNQPTVSPNGDEITITGKDNKVTDIQTVKVTIDSTTKAQAYAAQELKAGTYEVTITDGEGTIEFPDNAIVTVKVINGTNSSKAQVKVILSAKALEAFKTANLAVKTIEIADSAKEPEVPTTQDLTITSAKWDITSVTCDGQAVEAAAGKYALTPGKAVVVTLTAKANGVFANTEKFEDHFTATNVTTPTFAVTTAGTADAKAVVTISFTAPEKAVAIADKDSGSSTPEYTVAITGTDVAKNYDISLSANKGVKGDKITVTLTQKTAAALAENATVTVTGTGITPANAAVKTAGVAHVAAEYNTATTLSANTAPSDGMLVAVENETETCGCPKYVAATQKAEDQQVVTLKTAHTAAVEGVITFEITIGEANINVTDLAVTVA